MESNSAIDRKNIRLKQINEKKLELEKELSILEAKQMKINSSFFVKSSEKESLETEISDRLLINNDRIKELIITAIFFLFSTIMSAITNVLLIAQVGLIITIIKSITPLKIIRENIKCNKRNKERTKKLEEILITLKKEDEENYQKISKLKFNIKNLSDEKEVIENIKELLLQEQSTTKNEKENIVLRRVNKFYS